MTPQTIDSPEAYANALKFLLVGGCIAYLLTGSLTLLLGHLFGVLNQPLPGAMVTFLVWWMLLPVLPSLVLHPVAVRRVRIQHAARLERAARVER